MSINLHLPSQLETLRPKITVVGVGGAGGNAVSNMIASQLEGVDFVIANTDAQAMELIQAQRAIQLGANVTRGLGAGAKPEVGRAAAEEAADDIAACIEGSHMVFITAGMGGGTGTGAAPVVARLAKEQGILTVGVVTKPFQFEGKHRMRMADAGIEELQEYVDTLIVIPNQNLFRIANEKTTFAEAFRMADEVLHSGVRGVTDLIVKPGLVNLDFADIRAVMSEMGKAMMGTGEAVGDRRAVDAAESAISNPLLDDVSLKGAKAVLINITGGPDMTLYEVDEAANRIRDEVDPDANIIFGSTFSDAMSGKMRVSVVATGIDQVQAIQRPGQSHATYQPQMQPQPSVPQPVKPFTFSAPKPQAAAPVARERTASEIVRQAGSSANEMARATQEKIHQSAARYTPHAQATQTAHQPQMIRIIDESAVEQVAPESLPNVFISPRAERPAQAVLPQMQAVMPQQAAEEEYYAEEESDEGPSLFSRLGKALGGSKDAKRDTREAPVAEVRKSEVRVVAPSAAEEQEEDYDIPAFLRRQAN